MSKLNYLSPIFVKYSLGLIICLLNLNAWSQHPSDSVTRDSSTGDWIFIVTNPETNQQKVWRYVPTNQFTPRVHQSIRWAGQDQFEYDYLLHNDRRSKQDISYFWLTEAVMDTTFLASTTVTLSPSMTIPQRFDAITIRENEKDAKIAKFLTSPKGWNGRIRNNNEQIGIRFGWFPKANVSGNEVKPGQTLRGMSITRPELPVVGLAEMQGNTDQRGRAVGLPDTGPLADAWDQIEAVDTVIVPVLVPGIQLAKPYSAAAHATALKKEVLSWPKIHVATTSTAQEIAADLDNLITQLNSSQPRGAEATAEKLFRSLFKNNHGMTHKKFDQDDDEHDTQPLPERPLKPTVMQQREYLEKSANLHRVAARALGFNLMYLLTRFHAERPR